MLNVGAYTVPTAAESMVCQLSLLVAFCGCFTPLIAAAVAATGVATAVSSSEAGGSYRSLTTCSFC